MENLFAKRLRALRTENRIGQVQLAKAIGTSKAIISLWESGSRMPTLTHIRRLCDFFNVTADYLIGRTDK